MVVTLETGLVIGSLLASFTYCCVKIIHQVQNSKCKMIDCCGSKCIRDVDVDLDEVEVSQPAPSRSSLNKDITIPRPRLNSGRSASVEELKRKFEQ